MTEDEAVTWLRTAGGADPRAMDVLERFANMLIAENARQNLIAPNSVSAIWARHIADSAQLVRHGPAEGLWVDIGSGAGLPGIVVAALRPAPMLLVEPRRKRAEFLFACAAELQLSNVVVEQRDIRKVCASAAVISARAVASINGLFDMAEHINGPRTQWVLPKGRNAANELESAQKAWQGMFHVEPSVTESGSMIIFANDVARKRR